MNELFLYLITALSWSLPFFLYKEFTKYFSQIDIMILIHVCWHITILSLLTYYLFFDKPKIIKFINKIKKMPKKFIYYFLIIIIIGFIGQYSKLTLFKNNNVSKVIPIIRGISSIFIILLGAFIFKEYITFIKILGIIVILLGIYMINSDN